MIHTFVPIKFRLKKKKVSTYFQNNERNKSFLLHVEYRFLAAVISIASRIFYAPVPNLF